MTSSDAVENLLPKKHPKQPDFGVGTRLWRPALTRGQSFEVQDPVFEKDRQSWIVRATWGQGYKTDGWIAVGTADQGLVCFCRDEIPEDWTYFEVIKVADTKKWASVKPVSGSQEEVLEQYYR